MAEPETDGGGGLFFRWDSGGVLVYIYGPGNEVGSVWVEPYRWEVGGRGIIWMKDEEACCGENILGGILLPGAGGVC